ncbi:TIGR03085 family protein [Catenulispora sp. NF23]|uniref:TIGR03085 family protein n=1 Tax=Catenulispora pinistramenti TaxID=2705254 RepID=A0ABS5KYN8_9ACTN|nr:TIGR03085 family metal-binding protein [Catenulispora pinistramenti]MBS2534372.1 TIGR03085 family protein [Catenulispora pinistramenti]MBS2551176.1 TIGR03085 family protein [Catenulispora pinistramenti]
MPTYARTERAHLAQALTEAGPDAPTLCQGWTARDLAAHVVVRERRVDAAGGILVKALAPRLERVQAEFAARPWEELLDMVASGPSRRSLFGLASVDEAANVVEFFVHCEDVRRARGGWEPRMLDAGLSEVLWKRASGLARLMGRRAPAGLVLRRPDGQTAVAHKGAPVVTVTAEPAELVMFMSGRQGHAVVAMEGPDDAVAAVRSAKFGL